jgi:CDP-diacylglycerol--serine O-phosphatidyltransferase
MTPFNRRKAKSSANLSARALRAKNKLLHGATPGDDQVAVRRLPRRGIYLLPNAFTTAALFCGFYAIVMAMNLKFDHASIAIFAAMVLDSLDGRVARLTHTESEFGAQYDSLSDMVSFGAAPALVVYEWSLRGMGKLGWLAAFVYCAGAALRLARFNTNITVVDKRYFQGLPSPAAAALVAGFVWLMDDLRFAGADLMLGSQATTGNQGWCTRLVFQDEALRVFAGLDVFQALTHRVLGIFGHDTRTGDIFAVLCIVRNRVIHVGDTAFVNQIDDQFQLVQTLEIRHFRCIASFYQSFKARFDQFDSTTAQNCLLTEQIGFGFFTEVSFNDACTTATVRHCIRQCNVARHAGFILVDGDQVRHTAALSISTAYCVTRCFRRDHDDIEIGARHDLAVMHVKAVRECQYRTLLGMWRNVFIVNLSDILVRQQNHDDVCSFDRIVDFGNIQASVLSLVPGSAALAQTNRHFATGVIQILCMRMTLGTVTDDGYIFTLDQGQVAIFIVENFHNYS